MPYRSRGPSGQPRRVSWPQSGRRCVTLRERCHESNPSLTTGDGLPHHAEGSCNATYARLQDLASVSLSPTSQP